MKAIWRFPERGALAALLILLCLYIAPHVSFAHAYPEHADPKVGSMVAVAPSVVRIWFDSALEPLFSTISVKNQSGEIVDKGDGRVDASDPTLLEASVPPLP